MLSTQSFSSIFDGGFGYSTASNSTTKSIRNKRNDFSEELAIRLQDTQIEAIDAVRLIKARDRDFSFFYVDPPYVNSDCGHYDGYTWDDFEKLLTTLSEIKGKFLLSSYPSPMLKEFTKRFGWHTETVTQKVSVANSAKGDKPKKIKTEVLTYNYPKP